MFKNTLFTCAGELLSPCSVMLPLYFGALALVALVVLDSSTRHIRVTVGSAGDVRGETRMHSLLLTLLSTKLYLSDLKTQFVPRRKHLPRL